MFRSALALDAVDDLGPFLGLEQMRVATLGAQVFTDAHLVPNGRGPDHLPSSASKTGNTPLWVASRATSIVSFGALPQPSGHGTRCAGSGHRGIPSPARLGLQVPQIGDGRGGDVGNLVRHRDQRHVLALAEPVTRLGTDCLSGGGAGPLARRW